MNLEKLKPLHWLIICVVVIAISAFIAHSVEGDFGNVEVEIVEIDDPTGAVLTGKLYRPKEATAGNPLPGILALHGYQNDKGTQSAFAIELSRRGFVVLALDLMAHGDSDPVRSSATDPSWGGNSGYQYLKNLAYVDSENLGIMGHSLGAGFAIAVGLMNSDHKAINVQCGPPGSVGLNNVLLTQARFEEFPGFRENEPRVEELTSHPNRISAFGLTKAYEWDTTYGSFEDGSARRAALINTVHPAVTHNGQAVTEAVDWMLHSLKGGVEDSNWIPAGEHIYMWKEWMTLVALLTTLISFIPLTNILLELPFFEGAVQPMPSGYTATKKSWWTLAILNTVIAGVTYPILTNLNDNLSLSVRNWYSMAMGNGVALWFLGNALIFGVLFVIWYRRSGKKQGIRMYDMGISFNKKKAAFDWKILGKTALLGGALLGWAYLLVGISQGLLGIEFRFLWPFLRQFSSLARFGRFWLYLIPALLFFLLNGGIFFFGQARMDEYETPAKTQVVWWLRICFAGLFGLALIWLIQYAPYLWMGKPLGFEALGLPDYSGMWPLMLFVYIPEFAVLLFLLTWFFRRTGRIYLGALVIASLTAWIITAGSIFYAG